jgi:hypothetical protein
MSCHALTTRGKLPVLGPSHGLEEASFARGQSPLVPWAEKRMTGLIEFVLLPSF